METVADGDIEFDGVDDEVPLGERDIVLDGSAERLVDDEVVCELSTERDIESDAEELA